MSQEQLNTVYNAVDCIQKVYKFFNNDYNIIITADHGGNGRVHGLDISEDMSIPLFICGEGKGQLPHNAGIMDIAPSIAKLLGLNNDQDWNGKSLL